MPSLPRTTGRLLRTVGGKPHATADDHEESMPTPPASHSTRSSLSESKQQQREDEDDVFADPKSSSEDEKQAPVPGKSGGFRPPRPPPTSGVNDTHTGSLLTFRKPFAPPAPSPSSGSSKRSFDAVEGSDDSDDGMIFSSQASQGSSKIPGAPNEFRNIHAAKKRKGPKVDYSKKNRPQSRDQQSGSKSKGFVTKKTPAPNHPNKPKPTFRHVQGNPGKENTKPTATFKSLPAASALPTLDPSFADLSDSDSSLSLPPPSPEIEVIELSPATPYIATEPCAICSEPIPTSLREDFEDLHAAGTGKKLNFKRQQQFCTYHKQATAKSQWKERNYPTIDWTNLDARLETHHDFLRQLLAGKVSSAFRDTYAAQQKGRKKTAKSLAADTSSTKTSGTHAGYYGPRGEQVITQHLLSAFGDELRAHSVTEKAMASSGVGGGVSGYVQQVLVPELAARLVAQDLGLGGEEAARVLEESGEVGVMVNAEVVSGRGKRRQDEEVDEV